MHAVLIEMIVRRGTVPETVKASITVLLRVSCACVAALLRLMEGQGLFTEAELQTCIYIDLSQLRLKNVPINLSTVLIDLLVISMHWMKYMLLT